MSTAKLLQSIGDHAVRQRQQLRVINAERESLVLALSHIMRIGHGGDSDSVARSAMVACARDAILALGTGAECEPL